MATTPEECDPDQFPAPSMGCAVARCMAPPAGCEYDFEHYVVNDNGDCCPSLCYAVDSAGNECVDVMEEEEESDVLDTKNATNSTTVWTGEDCSPTGGANETEGCPMAKCGAPPKGCEYDFEHYVMGEDGTCCPELCYAVDALGNECTTGVNATTNMTLLESGDECTPDAIPVEGCPVARCAAPPKGCEYDMEHYLMNDMGGCCPALCFAVDSSGQECTATSASKTITSASTVPNSGGLLTVGGGGWDSLLVLVLATLVMIRRN